MRAVLQRVTSGSVAVDNEVVAQLALAMSSCLGSDLKTRRQSPGTWLKRLPTCVCLKTMPAR